MRTDGAPHAEVERPSRSLAALEPGSTLIAVVEMSLSSWLVAGIVPGVERQPLKKLAVDESALLKLLHRWREEAEKAGRRIERIVVAFEAGRDGFWLARWLRAHSIDAYVIHAASVAVSREHRRAKTDRLDSELLKRAFLGWLRGERDHCKMVAIPTAKDEDAKRPNRERESLVGEQNLLSRCRLETEPSSGASPSEETVTCARSSCKQPGSFCYGRRAGRSTASGSGSRAPLSASIPTFWPPLSPTSWHGSPGRCWLKSALMKRASPRRRPKADIQNNF